MRNFEISFQALSPLAAPCTPLCCLMSSWYASRSFACSSQNGFVHQSFMPKQGTAWIPWLIVQQPSSSLPASCSADGESPLANARTCTRPSYLEGLHAPSAVILLELGVAPEEPVVLPQDIADPDSSEVSHRCCAV